MIVPIFVASNYVTTESPMLKDILSPFYLAPHILFYDILAVFITEHK